jgi:hypothetical protein
MNIGIFGDSFAEKGYVDESDPSIWYNFLKKHHGHEIECFGESGSSILFSAQLLLQHASKFDLCIWCLTTPGRFSYQVDGTWFHVCNAQDQWFGDDIETKKKNQASIDYLTYLFDWPTENFVGESIVINLQRKIKNLLIIPCFPTPLQVEFYLYDLCEWELQHYFPNSNTYEIYKRYQDLRAGHITKANQKILSDLINQDLRPGIFQTEHKNFVTPTERFDEIFGDLT